MPQIRGQRRAQLVASVAVGFLFAIVLLNPAAYAQTQPFPWSGVIVNPRFVNFGSVNVGTTSRPVVATLQNVSDNNVTITGVSLSLAEITYLGPLLPVTLNPGDTLQIPLIFTPDAARTFTGSMLFTEDNGRLIWIRLNGTGIVQAPAQLSTSSTNLDFGSVTIGTTTSQTVTLSNTGGLNLTISAVSLSGAGFNANGVGSGLILTPGQSSSLTVTFDPAATGNLAGSVSIASGNSSVTIVLSGNGVAAQTSYTTILSWDLDDSATNGYNVYSGTTTGGPYTKLTSTSIAPNTYTDSSVQAGLTYYYVVTAIESDGAESAYSNEIAAQIP